MANKKQDISQVLVGEETRQLADFELERKIVSQLMLESYAHITELRTLIKSEDFYYDTPRMLYRFILFLNDKGEEATVHKVANEVMKRQLMPIDKFLETYTKVDLFPTYIELIEHIYIFIDYAKRRRLWIIGQKLIREGTSTITELSSVAEAVKGEIDDVILGSAVSDSVTMSDVLLDLNKLVADNMGGLNDGMKTNSGFKWIDEHGGLFRSDLDIIAADSSVGKSSMAISMTTNVIKQHKHIAYYSLEMTKMQLVAKILAPDSHLRSNVILTEKFTPEQLRQFDDGVTAMSEYGQYLHFDDKPTLTLDAILASVRKHKAKYGIEGFVVDFIQRVHGQGANEKDEAFLARISQSLKNVCLELNIWCLALSQLSRDKDSASLPTRNRLRGSGQIVEAADNIWIIYRPEFYNKTESKDIRYPKPFDNINVEGTAEIIVSKSRNNETGSFICGFDSNTTRFYQLDNPPTICLTAEQADRAVHPSHYDADGNPIESKLPF